MICDKAAVSRQSIHGSRVISAGRFTPETLRPNLTGGGPFYGACCRNHHLPQLQSAQVNGDALTPYREPLLISCKPSSGRLHQRSRPR